MKIRHTTTFVIILIIMAACQSELKPAKEIHILPKPVNQESKDGRFLLQQNTKLFIENHWDGLTTAIKSLETALEHKPELSDKARRGQIIFRSRDMEHKEAYELNIYPDSCCIYASDGAGAFYAVQSLKQIIFQGDSTETGIELPVCRISDYPRFHWRGMHLDVCRHFFTVEEVKTFLDIMALHKLNRFHWHLTEDQGWRIEIKQYPKLTEIGSQRSETVIGKNTGEYDGTPHGGFYTQEEIREVVDYARARHITVVPEIEMPGHSLAALAAYPELGCTGGPYEVATTWGVFEDVYCAGNDSTLIFMKNVLDEVIALFPSDYIHIGGDECPKARWENCSRCQKRMAREGLENEHELQSWFIQEVEHYLNDKGRQIIGWDEIMEGGLAENAALMSWRGESGGIKAAKSRHYVVMSPNDVCYFDHYQHKDTKNEPFAIGGLTTLSDVYDYEPVPEELSEQESQYIMGAQANLWTEYITDEDHLQYMMLPRAAALAELVWSPESEKKYGDFLDRLQSLQNLYTEYDWNYAGHDPD
ncbi:MAG: beta-N-acetylhexosaminidase [Bacteroidota bacterium]